MIILTSFKARAHNRNTPISPIRNLLICLLVLLPSLLLSGHAHAVDAPTNIRLEQNLLQWDEVAGVSNYDIYLLNYLGPNANGTYITTVVNANEFVLSTAGIYTVVSSSDDGTYSTLDSGGRAVFSNNIDTSNSYNIGAIDAPANIRLEDNLLQWDEVADVSKYDIYLLTNLGPNANGTYIATVVDANEYALNTAGIYTVVSASLNAEYSSLDSGDRAVFSSNIDTMDNIGAIDAPANIRLEENLLLWDEVAGVSKYDIYLMNYAGPNANGTYITTVVNTNEFMLNTAGIYTVVSASSIGEYSSLDEGDRALFNIEINE